MNKRITKMLSAGMLIPELDPSKNKVMVCGSNNFNSEVKTMLTDWKWQEGTRQVAGTFVQEKAFVS